MKKLTFYSGIIGLCWVFIFPTMAYAQPEKEEFSKKQDQAEIVADSNQYLIGPEDVIYIHTWNEEALSRTVTVRADGKISFPLVDEVQAAGLTPLQLKKILIEKFKKFIFRPNVSVTVMEANSVKVYVSGYVKTPGSYPIRSETSVLQIISMAGGFINLADQEEILIIRKENGKEKRITVNYKKLVEGKEPASSSIVKPGDTIVVSNIPSTPDIQITPSGGFHGGPPSAGTRGR